MDINTLRSMRKSSSDFSAITKELEKVANPQSNNQEDDRFWKPERDKAGNASAVIRFLPKTANDELPWVKVYSHGFKGPSGRWYIENSLSTIGEEDGIALLNRELWNSTTDDNHPNRKQARDQKRRLNYISNILVVSDPKHPENEGKVFLFRYGKKIFDKIMDAGRPTFEDVEPVNVFDYWEGANFRLRMKQVDGYPNYDQSVFDSKSAIAEDDEEILKIANSQYTLFEFIDPNNKKQFKSREELDKKLAQVMNTSNAAQQKTAEQLLEEDAKVEKQSKPVKVTQKASQDVSDDLPTVGDDDFDIDAFIDDLKD